MNSKFRVLSSTAAAAGLLLSYAVHASTSIANISVVGYVPSIFSVASIGQDVILDLTPGSSVSNRTIGVLAFRYNEDVQNLLISSDTTNGLPENPNGDPYQFGGSGDFRVAFEPSCDTVDATYFTPFPLTNAGVDVKSALASALVNTGVQENCTVGATYTGTNTTMPLAGRFEMKIVVTMVSF